jgi:hypothetical protein
MTAAFGAKTDIDQNMLKMAATFALTLGTT